MKKKIYFYLPLVFIMSLCLFLFPSSAKAQPKIEFNETEYDLGKIYQNKKKDHVFTFKNAGTETLTIEKVKAG